MLIALVLSSFSLVALLLHMPSVTAAAADAVAVAVARQGAASAVLQLGGDIPHPAGGLLILIVVAVLTLCEPRGLNPYG